MARPLRIDRPDGWYHLTARGNERKSIFRDDHHRRHFLDLPAERVARFAVRLHGFVLMDKSLSSGVGTDRGGKGSEMTIDVFC
jgi:putative transposase